MIRFGIRADSRQQVGGVSNVSSLSPSPKRGLVSLDVAIVGAGPAGGAAAIALAGRGLRVGIVEKAVPPRYKTCGGGVLWRAIKLLPVDVRAAVERECAVAELVYHNPSLRFLCRREHPIVSMVMRDQFDHLLIKAAQAAGGVELFAGTTVLDVTATNEGVRLMSRVEGVPSTAVCIGQRVKARVVQQGGQGVVVFDLLEGAAA